MLFALKISVLVLVIILFIFLLLATTVVMIVSHPPCSTHESHIESEHHQQFMENYDELPKEEYLVEGYNGYQLHTVYIPAEEPSNRFVIISHGYTSNYHSSIKYMLMFRRMGYNGIIYDDRRHGYNKKKRTVCSLGVFESQDLIEIIKDTRQRYGDDIYIGLHGESMGSGLSVMSLTYKPDIHFIVNDCGYSDMNIILYSHMKTLFHMPNCMVTPACAIGRLLFGFSYRDIKPLEALTDNTVPICFIHGADDDFITPEHSKMMHAATKGYSELHIFPNAKHAESFVSNPKKYYLIVENFLRRVYHDESGGKKHEKEEYLQHN